MKYEVGLPTKDLSEDQIKEVVYAIYKCGYEVYQSWEADKIRWLVENKDEIKVISKE